MASAILARTNEQHWGNKVYVRKYATSSVNRSHLNPNPSNVAHRTIPSPSLPQAWQSEERNAPALPRDRSCRNNRRPDDANNRRESYPSEYLTFNLAECSGAELKELKRRLLSELDQVRRLRLQIEKLDAQNRSCHAICRPPLLQIENQSEPKARLTPKANQPPQPPAAVLVSPKTKPVTPCGRKKVIGQKRASSSAPDRDPKRLATPNQQLNEILTSMTRRCAQILGKLMKHKHGWVFNTPVDTVSLGLQDYHQIIKHPMDLGTVKARLRNKEYKLPLDFASDVRLTFTNAMTYNPKGQDVHFMADALLAMFEKAFNPAFKKFEAQYQQVLAAVEGSKRDLGRVEEPMLIVRGVQGPLPNAVDTVNESDFISLQEPLQCQPVVQAETTSTSAQMCANPDQIQRPIPNLLKPKASDANKRLMTFEEKSNLAESLQDMPSNKMGPMLAILSKTGLGMAPEGDEIELDFEALDNDTLWELDRFVCNLRKAENKMKGQGLVNDAVVELQIEKPPTREPMPEVLDQKIKKADAVEEDVDIGEDSPLNNYPPVEIEKDTNCNSSRSSSSGSGSSSSCASSSSSGSGSMSPSGSDSDEDSVQSPYVEPKGVL